MRYRRFGRLGWEISEVGYGMWGIGGWSGSEDEQSLASLARAIELGCNFFDTAWAYGGGHSEKLLGETLGRHRGPKLYVATKVPPKNLRWPALTSYPLEEVFPADHIREYTEKSLENLGVDAIDLQQLHVWTDAWARDPRWQRAFRALKDEGLVRGVGISVNRWEPANVLEALESGLVDSVQVVYNVFDQAPEDALFPACERLGVAVVARVPFDEGSLTGALRPGASWPEGDWRNIYFTPENLDATLTRVDALRAVVPSGMDLPELALRFVLNHPTVSTTIPGMRKTRHVERNLGSSDGKPLNSEMLSDLRRHRWDRTMVIP